MTGHECRTLRQAAGLKQKALAEALGVWGNTVSRWENGVGGKTRDVPEPVARLIRMICAQMICAQAKKKPSPP